MSEPGTTPHARCATATLTPLDLRNLAVGLLATTAGVSAVGVRIARHGSTELLAQPFSADTACWHPADLLVGFRAPSSWGAFGISAHGRAEQIGADGEIPVPTSSPRPLAHLVARSGASCTVLAGARPCDEPQVFESNEPVPGLLADACRRALGLATSPDAPSLESWVTSCWLDRAVAHLASGAGRASMTWEALVAAHPCASHLPATVEPHELASRVRATLHGGWEQLHQALTADQPWRTPAGPAAAQACPPRHARWLDAPSLARYVSSLVPPRQVMLDVIAELADPSTASQIHEAVEGSAA